MSGLTTQIGNLGEDAAVEWLRERGYYIVERNWRAGSYEIDIIAQHFDTMHFVEVKTRALGSIESAYEAINTTKRTALLRAMRAYTRTARYGCEYQVDLAAVEACLDGSFIMHYNENIMG